ncbi:Binding--dependent transport system inner membrane component family protein [Arthrobacter sp. 9AX]|uniref:carbohydrate ABC transporter permease n=1 Tax=Arthrobacter sp. 9AX TaxID=2653131 RepID=UPI0012F0B5B8|nr:sugar ABC transporter permease [Arthrobacter sp. 9AX]VXB43545.1 Binding--dependent transport system inner membrane component family protein [Arthrobacter sp. 9AX]
MPARLRGRGLLRYLPLLPAVLLLLVFLAGPVFWAFQASFTNTGLTGRHARNPEWVGLDNYQRLLLDPVFPLSLGLTVLFVAGSAVLGQNLLGLALAVLMRRARRSVSALVGTAVVAAWVLPEIVAAFAAYAYFSRDGTLNQLLGGLGMGRPDWLYSWPMVAVVLANVWRGTAFSMLVYRAALNDIPTEVAEAAQVDGAGGWQRLAFITLPMIRRSIATNLMLITLQTLAVFTLVWVMTAGGPANASTTLPVLAYQEAFKFGDIGYGTAVASVLLLIGAVFGVGYIRLLREEKQ